MFHFLHVIIKGPIVFIDLASRYLTKLTMDHHEAIGLIMAHRLRTYNHYLLPICIYSGYHYLRSMAGCPLSYLAVNLSYQFPRTRSRPTETLGSLVMSIPLTISVSQSFQRQLTKVQQPAGRQAPEP